MKTNLTERNKIYYAGLIDGEGCFCIPLSVRKRGDGRRFINLQVQVRIGMDHTGKEVLMKFHEKAGLGKFYESRNNTPSGISTIYSWQVTKWREAKVITEVLLPYFEIKKDIAKKFLAICDFHEKTNRDYNPREGEMCRTREEMEWIIKESMALNAHVLQTKNHRSVRDWEFYKDVLDEMYTPVTINRGGMPAIYSEDDILSEIRSEFSKGPVTQKTHKNLTARAHYRFGTWGAAKMDAFKELSPKELYLQKILTPKELRKLGVDTSFITRKLERLREGRVIWDNQKRDYVKREENER